MQSIGTSYGVALRFDTIDDLRKTISNLQGFLEFIESSKEGEEPWYYLSFRDCVPKDEIESLKNMLKTWKGVAEFE